MTGINKLTVDEAHDALVHHAFRGKGVVLVVVDATGQHIEYRSNMVDSTTTMVLDKVRAASVAKESGNVSPLEIPPWRRT